MANLYGAAVADVNGHLPHRRPFAADTKPTSGQVDGFLDQVASQVQARIGNLLGIPDSGDDPTPRARVIAFAKTVTTWGAAALAEAASHPDTVSPNDTSSYATWLWERYESHLADLVALADLLDVGAEPAAGADVVAADPAGHFPPPMFTRRTGF